MRVRSSRGKDTSRKGPALWLRVSPGYQMAFPIYAVLKGQFPVRKLRPGSYPSWVTVLQITSLVFVIPLLLAGYSGSSRDL